MRARQRGFTLVEMVLASALAMFIVLMVVQAYQANQQSYQYQTAITKMQADARYISTIMVMHLSRALDTAGSVVGTTDLVNFRDTVTTNNDYTVAGSPTKTCNGSNITTGADPDGTSTFSVDSSAAFSCDSDYAGFNQVLVENVEHLRILYGIDTQTDASAGELASPDDSASIDRWGDSTVVAALGLWDSVRAIQVGFILRSENPIGLDTKTRSYTLLDQTLTKNDGRLRYVFSFTVALGNRI